MTTRPRELNAPLIDAQTMASRRTARGFHGFALADLADDAATGHPGQRATVLQNSGGAFHAFVHPATTSRILSVALTVSWNGDWTPPDYVAVKLSLDDGVGGTIAYTDPEVPRGWKDEPHWPSAGATRVDSMARTVGYLDKVALIAAGLDATVPWRLTFEVTCGATTFCEAIEVAELSRFAIDSTESFGEFPQNYRPRGVIDDHLSRIGATLEAAYFSNRHTYQAISLDDSAGDVVTATSFAAIPGSQTQGSAARAWKVRPRRILGEPRVLFGVRYKKSGTSDAEVRLTTGGAGSPVVLTLPGTSGAWADVLTGSTTLADAATDTLTWEARVVSGALTLVTYVVTDDPA